MSPRLTKHVDTKISVGDMVVIISCIGTLFGMFLANHDEKLATKNTLVEHTKQIGALETNVDGIKVVQATLKDSQTTLEKVQAVQQETIESHKRWLEALSSRKNLTQ